MRRASLHVDWSGVLNPIKWELFLSYSIIYCNIYSTVPHKLPSEKYALYEGALQPMQSSFVLNITEDP